jgi:hypothetical protein
LSPRRWTQYSLWKVFRVSQVPPATKRPVVAQPFLLALLSASDKGTRAEFPGHESLHDGTENTT